MAAAVTLKVYSRWAEREESKAVLSLASPIFGAVESQEQTGSECCKKGGLLKP